MKFVAYLCILINCLFFINLSAQNDYLVDSLKNQLNNSSLDKASLAELNLRISKNLSEVLKGVDLAAGGVAF